MCRAAPGPAHKLARAIMLPELPSSLPASRSVPWQRRPPALRRYRTGRSRRLRLKRDGGRLRLSLAEPLHATHPGTSASASLPSLLDLTPTLRIVDEQWPSSALFRDQKSLPVRIIVDFGVVCQRKIKVSHVEESRIEPALNDLGRNRVAALTDSPRHSGDRVLRRGKAKEKQTNEPAIPLASFKKGHVGSSGAGRLEAEALAAPHKISHSFNHPPARSQRSGLDVLRRDLSCDLISIQEFMQIEEIREKNPCRSRLACTVGPAYQNDFFHEL